MDKSVIYSFRCSEWIEVCQAVRIIFKLLHIHYLRIQLETSRRFFLKCDAVMWISLFLHKAITLIKVSYNSSIISWFDASYIIRSIVLKTVFQCCICLVSSVDGTCKFWNSHHKSRYNRRSLQKFHTNPHSMISAQQQVKADSWVSVTSALICHHFVVSADLMGYQTSRSGIERLL